MALSRQVLRLRLERARALSVLIAAGFGLVAIGLVRLQVADHDAMEQLAKENHVRLEVLRAPRGSIYDRNGELLADSAPSFSVVFRPFPAESSDAARRTITPEWLMRVARICELDTIDLRQIVLAANKSGRTGVLRYNAPFAIRAAVEEGREDLPAVDVAIEPLRHYAHGTLAAHLLGYANELSVAELDSLAPRGYKLGDLIGRSGLERSYEELLRGEDGAEYVVVNAAGRRVATLRGDSPKLPVPGHDLILTVDLKVQKAMELAMEGVERGAAVAIDPQDGGILGLVSRPAYDPNEFSVGISYDRWQRLSDNGANPLLNRVIQGTYPPGSTFKMVSMTGALRAGIMSSYTRLQPCTGSYQFGGRLFKCWKHDGHGSLDFIEALEKSCDVYFYQVGPRLGLPRLEQMARDFGFGDRTGIDLPQEKKGLIPSPAWYDQRWGSGRWRPGLMLNLTIGQGELLVTPLQLATMMAEIANSGRTVQPHLVKEVRGIGPSPLQRAPRARIEAGPGVWQAVQRGLEKVVETGTGTAAKVEGIRVAGKTGTAQNSRGKDHALFACYAPADHPRIAMAFVIENAGHGGSIAAPRAGQVLRTLLLPDSLQHPPRLRRASELPGAPAVAHTPAAEDSAGVANAD
jgi:penicillin-binding protein 2